MIRDKHGFCMLSSFERSKHSYQFDLDFDHSHINVVTYVHRKQSEKPQTFPQKQLFFFEKVFSMYLLLDLSLPFIQNSRDFFNKCYLVVVHPAC